MLGAGLALYHLVADGEQGAECYSVAGDRDQARIVFDEAMRMVRLEPELNAVLRVRDAQATILHPSSDSLYRAIASDSATAEGYNPSFVCFDEVHVQTNGRLWTVMSNGSATRDRALMLGITTAGYDVETLCGQLYKAGRAGTPGMYFFWLEPKRVDCDWRDERIWHEVNPGLDEGFQRIEDFRAAAAEAAARGAENEFRRYRLNQWVGAIEAWLPYGAWDALRTDELLQEEESVVLGFDGSWNKDCTAIVACALRETPHIQPLHLWERPDGPAGDGWRVPILDVEAAIIEACKRYDVREVVCDPFRWQRSMAVLEEAGVPISEYPTSSPARMVPSTALFTDAVMDGHLSHDGSIDLKRHIANAKLKRDAKGPRIVKESTGSAKHIDLAVAAVIALDRAMHLEPEEEELPVPNIW